MAARDENPLTNPEENIMQELNHKEVAVKSEEFKKFEGQGKGGMQFADVLSETWGAKLAVKNDAKNDLKVGVGKEKEISFDDCYSGGKGADKGVKSAIKLEDGEIKGGKPAIKLEDGEIKGGKPAIKLEDGEIKGGKPAIKLEDGGLAEKKWVPAEKEPTKPVVPNDGGVKSGGKSKGESMDGGPKDIIKKPLLNLDEYSFLKKGA